MWCFTCIFSAHFGRFPARRRLILVITSQLPKIVVIRVLFHSQRFASFNPCFGSHTYTYLATRYTHMWQFSCVCPVKVTANNGHYFDDTPLSKTLFRRNGKRVYKWAVVQLCAGTISFMFPLSVSMPPLNSVNRRPINACDDNLHA